MSEIENYCSILNGDKTHLFAESFWVTATLK
jgi:hypothetical protein